MVRDKTRVARRRGIASPAGSEKPLIAFALAPDLAMLGYLGGIGVLGASDVAVQVALIWGAHIGADRALGYGLKYPTGFEQTPLQRL
jgi:hypothetical protein